jgi:hypothetical protein
MIWCTVLVEQESLLVEQMVLWTNKSGHPVATRARALGPLIVEFIPGSNQEYRRSDFGLLVIRLTCLEYYQETCLHY